MENKPTNEVAHFARDGTPLNMAAQQEHLRFAAQELKDPKATVVSLQMEVAEKAQAAPRSASAAPSQRSVDRSPSPSRNNRKVKANDGNRQNKKKKTSTSAAATSSQREESKSSSDNDPRKYRDKLRDPKWNKAHLKLSTFMRLADCEFLNYKVPGQQVTKLTLQEALRLLENKDVQWVTDAIFTDAQGGEFDLIALGEFCCMFGKAFTECRHMASATNYLEMVLAYLLKQFDGDLAELNRIVNSREAIPPPPPQFTRSNNSAAASQAEPPPPTESTSEMEARLTTSLTSTLTANMKAMFAELMAQSQAAASNASSAPSTPAQQNNSIALTPPAGPATPSSSSGFDPVTEALVFEWTKLVNAKQKKRGAIDKKSIFTNCDAPVEIRADYLFRQIVGEPPASTIRSFDEYLCLVRNFNLDPIQPAVGKNTVLSSGILSQIKAHCIGVATQVQVLLEKNPETPTP